MARQYTITMMPNGQGWKPEVIPSDAAAVAPGANEMSIGYATDVEAHRTLEIHNGWRWLWNGIRDRNLLDVQFLGALLLSGANINSLTESNRRTSSTIGDFALGDVWVGVGSGVSTGAIGRGANQMLDSGFRMLREFAKENP